MYLTRQSGRAACSEKECVAICNSLDRSASRFIEITSLTSHTSTDFLLIDGFILKYLLHLIS